MLKINDVTLSLPTSLRCPAGGSGIVCVRLNVDPRQALELTKDKIRLHMDLGKIEVPDLHF